MSDTDAYGMTPEERAAFEQFSGGPWSRDGCGDYQLPGIHQEAQAWAACAKLYRERVQKTKDRWRKRWQACSDRREQENLAAQLEVDELRAEVERLRSDAARLDWFTTLCPHKLMRLRAMTMSPNWQGDLRAAIDAVMPREGGA